LTRYIHLNPVKAKIVTVPEEYPWSSCKGYLSKKGDGFIDRDRIKKYLNMGIADYRNFMLKGIGVEYNPFKDVYAGFLLGRVDFIKDKLKSLKEQIEGKEFSYKKELSAHLNEMDIIEAVARYYRKSPEELIEMKTRPATEKKITMYLLKRLTALTNNQIGRIFGISFSAASKAAKDIVRLIERNADIRRVTEEIISSFKA
ncbi:MAG: helix-turn-helix domain-containing protein, partial [Candidatus Omnitrophota bacterium]|nr:helix-turn-helix domain-containing protein [Candidatus Omnitrophota bacterium]